MGKLSALTGAVAAAAGIVVVWLGGGPGAALEAKDLAGLFLFFLINILSESKPLGLSSQGGGAAELTISRISSYALIALFPPFPAAMTGACAVLVSEALIKRKAFLKSSFNTCQTFLSLTAAALAYAWVIRHPITESIGQSTLAMAAAAVAYCLAHTGLASLTVTCLHGSSFWRNWSTHCRRETLYVIYSVPLALLLTVAYETLWIAAPILIVGPVLLLRESHSQYIRLQAADEIKREKEFSENLIDSSLDGIFAFDRECRYTLWSRGMERLTRMAEAQVLGKSALTEIPFLKDTGQHAYLTEILQGKTYISRDRAYMIPEVGRMVFFEAFYSPLRSSSGEVIGGLATVRDTTQRKHSEEALRESEERYALAARGANDGLWDWNLKTGEIYLSPRWKSMLGCGEDEIGTDPEDSFRRVHPEDVARVRADISAHLGGRTSLYENEHRMLHKDETYRWVLSRGLAVRDAEGNATRIAGSLTDITERKLAAEQLKHQALHDALVGIPNRTLFMERLKLALARAKRRDDYMFAVLFLDLDRFKVVNDSLGHMVGDQLLAAIAGRLTTCLRSTDMLARLGGDEFTILLDEVTDVNDAVRISERIHEKLAVPFQLGEHEVCMSASVGIALSAAGYQNPEDLLRDADLAMYRAKSLGKARHAMFATDMHVKAMDLLQLEADLRKAVEHQEFHVLYQPIVSLRTGRITRLEALVRWRHPRRGLIDPIEFMELAEETGLILPMSEWVLRMAMAQTRLWRAAGHPDLRVSVNVSARQFEDRNFVDLIRTILRETGLSPAALDLEITESTAMGAEAGLPGGARRRPSVGDEDRRAEKVKVNASTLLELTSLGVNMAIDDFGTGYSSLATLRRFPIDTLKIDRSFIRDVLSDSDDAAITRAIIAMGDSLNLKVVAEGVETEEQLEFLRSTSCGEVQGYLISRPLPVEACTRLLQKGNLLPRSGSLRPGLPSLVRVA